MSLMSQRGQISVSQKEGKLIYTIHQLISKVLDNK